MSQEDVEILRQALDAFNRRDRDAWLALCDPDLENVASRDWPESDPVRGREAAWELFVEIQQPWEDGSFEYGDVLEAGDDKVVAHMYREVRGRASGAPVPFSYWQVATFRDGKALRLEWFTDRAEALEAAGLRE